MPRTAIELIKSHEKTHEWRRQRVVMPEARDRFFENKYVCERLLGCLLLVIFTPVICVLWLIVKLTSKGPGFYRQARVGLDRQEFEIIKLRTMKEDAEKHGEVWSVQKDPRQTFVGSILRKLHLDELPQLLNVAYGQMVLVGPRPERPTICAALRDKVAGYDDRVSVKPGITGLSQVNLPPDASLDDVHKKQILDIQYINETNWWLELRILLATALRIVGVKGDTTMRSMRLCRKSSLESMLVVHPPVANVPKPTRREQWRDETSDARLAFAVAGEEDGGDSFVDDDSSVSPIRRPR